MQSQGALCAVVEMAAQRSKEGAVIITQEQRHLPIVSDQPAGVLGGCSEASDHGLAGGEGEGQLWGAATS